MGWVQVYGPSGSPLLSSMVAGLPILVLLGLLVSGVSAPRAAVVGLLTALVVAARRTSANPRPARSRASRATKSRSPEG